MYATNAKVESLASFPPALQRYLIKSGVPFLKKVGETAYFAKSRLLKTTLERAPDSARREVESIV